MTVLSTIFSFQGEGAPAGPTDPNFSSVKLLLHGDALTDHSSLAATVTANGVAAVSTAEKRFGTGSYLIRTTTSGSGTFDCLTIPGGSSEYDMGSGDFTLECSVYLLSTASCILISKQTGTGYYPWQLLLSGGQFLFRGFDTGLSLYYSVNASGSPTTGQWYDIQCRRSGSVFSIAVDGVELGTSTIGTNALYNDSGPINIGGFSSTNSTFGLQGYIEEVRITKGVARAYADLTAAFPDS